MKFKIKVELLELTRTDPMEYAIIQRYVTQTDDKGFVMATFFFVVELLRRAFNIPRG